MFRSIDPHAARELLYSLPAAYKIERIKLSEAQNRVLSSDISAVMPTPPFDRSPFDGYAFRGEDTASASKEHPVTLHITEEIPAGGVPTRDIKAGMAAKILTGAPIPTGANAVVKYEDTEFSADEVKLFASVRPDTDIVRAGCDIEAGSIIASAGTVVTAPLLGVFASQGIGNVDVIQKPRISIINTGSELIEVGQPLPAGMIYNSNVYTLCGYLRDLGADPVNAGVVMDDPDAIAGKIGDELMHSDMVITTGGASVGDYDWAVTSAEKLGADILFWKTSMKPGGSIMAAVLNNKLILGLSGNPGAAVLGLIRIAMPYIKKLCGIKDAMPQAVEVYLKKPFTKNSPKLRILRGSLEILDGKAYFLENEGQGNGAVFSLVGCDLLGEIPAGSPPLPAGAKISAYRI
jgi:molybdopterin molybdotransferase